MCRCFADLRRKKNRRSGFIALHALLLVICTITLFNSPDYVSDDLDKALKVTELTDRQAAARARTYMRSNFIFVDNADSRDQLTDRQAILNFVDFCLAHRTQIDFAVIDIGFDEPDTAHDRQLSQALSHLAAQGKLLVSVKNANDRLVSGLPDSIKGRITETVKDELFSFHRIYRDSLLSLPYLIYHRLDRTALLAATPLLERRVAIFSPFRINSFMPRIYDSLGYTATVKGAYLVQETQALRFFQSANAAKMLTAQLETRKLNGQHNVLFVGAFTGQEDRHRTLNGKLPGPAIILNIVYNLHLGKHVLSLQLVGGLFIIFWLLTYLMIYSALYEHHPSRAHHFLPEFLRKHAHRYWTFRELKTESYWSKFLMACLEFIYRLTFLECSQVLCLDYASLRL